MNKNKGWCEESNGLGMNAISKTGRLVIIAKNWKQANCPSPEESINKMRYFYTMEYYATIKKHEIIPSASTGMDLEIPSSDSEKHYTRSLIHGI